MTPVNITEIAVISIQNQIKATIAEALASVRTDEERTTNVNTEVPKSYFIATQQHAFRCPAIFTIAENVALNNDRGPNFISATLDIVVSVVVEERDTELLTKKAWRYQDALFKILNQTNFVNDPSGTVKYRFTSIVNNIIFSEDFSFSDESDKRSNFQKEVALELTVEMQQQP